MTSQTSKWESLLATLARQGPLTPENERRRDAMADFRRRQQEGKDTPDWHRWGEFAVTLEDGTEVGVLYDPCGEAERVLFSGLPGVAEFGVYPPARRKGTLAAWAQRTARALARAARLGREQARGVTGDVSGM